MTYDSQPYSQPWRGGRGGWSSGRGGDRDWGSGSGWGTGRGRGRGRGGDRFGGRDGDRGGFWSRSSTTGRSYGHGIPNPATTVSPEPPLGPLLSSLTKNGFDQKANEYLDVSLSCDLKTVASYNWLDRPEPTIAVPGKPAKWTPLDSPCQLKPDKGVFFRNPNSAHFPKYPMDPIVVAAVTMRPNVSLQTDVVACGSTIGNLLRFLEGEDKHFRILVELVGDTVFFIRRENTPHEPIAGVYGYGHSFPKVYTRWGKEVKGSTSHHRIVSYRFGELRFLVHFKGDGYIAGDDDSDQEDTESNSSGSADSDDDSDDTDKELELLSDALAGIRVASKLPDPTNNELKVVCAGKVVSHDQIFDLKTRSIMKKETETFAVTLADQLKRLWIAKIPNFILAYHSRGVFNDITVKAVEEQVEDWEIDHLDLLSRLAALVHHIIGLVRNRPDKKLELRHDAAGLLEVREQLADAGDVLSRNARELWENAGDSPTCEVSSSVGEVQ